MLKIKNYGNCRQAVLDGCLPPFFRQLEALRGKLVRVTTTDGQRRRGVVAGADMQFLWLSTPRGRIEIATPYIAAVETNFV